MFVMSPQNESTSRKDCYSTEKTQFEFSWPFCERHRRTAGGVRLTQHPPNEKPSSACRIATVHEERVTDHKAGTRAAEPEDGCGNLLRLAEAPDWFVLHHFVQDFGITADHRLHHWRLDRTWTDRVDADATGSVFEGGSLGQADHAVLGSVIGRQSGVADDAADRRAIDNGAAALPEHLAQLLLHATPHTAQVDRHHAIPLVAADVSRFDTALHEARLLECGVQPPEADHRSFDHRCHLIVI